MFEREVGPGIVLRQFAPPDADLLFAVVEKNREYLREWLPWVDQTRSAAVVRDFILRARAQAADGRGPQAAIWIGGPTGRIGRDAFHRLAEPELQHRLLARGGAPGPGHHDALLPVADGLPV